MKLHLACGNTKLSGWVNVDISPQVNPDVVADLTKIPWSWISDADRYIIDGSVDEIYSSHFIEHLGDEFIPFMDECHRVLKPGGLFRIRCPYYSSIRAWQDPTHKRAISEATFHYFNAKERNAMGVSHYGIKSDFDVQELRLHFPENMQQMPEDERTFMLTHALNTAADIEVLLKKHDPNEQGVDRQKNKMVSN